MTYRDDRDALRAKVDKLDDQLARAEATIAELRGSRSARRAQMAKRAAVPAGVALVVLATVAVATVAYLRRAGSAAVRADAMCKRAVACCRKRVDAGCGAVLRLREMGQMDACKQILATDQAGCSAIISGPGDACEKAAACCQHGCEMIAEGGERSCEGALRSYGDCE